MGARMTKGCLGPSNRRILEIPENLLTAGIRGELFKQSKLTTRTLQFVAKFRLGRHKAPNKGTKETKPPHTQNEKKQRQTRRANTKRNRQCGQTKPPHTQNDQRWMRTSEKGKRNRREGAAKKRKRPNRNQPVSRCPRGMRALVFTGARFPPTGASTFFII